MFSKEINVLLLKALDCVPLTIGGRSLRHDIDDVVAMVFPKGNIGIVSDTKTAEAYGNHIFQALKGRFNCTPIHLEGTPVADLQTVDYICHQAKSCDALIAVGSGTINDVCKYASFLEGKPYLVFPTAASMNGYLSANASISVDGYKKTMAAHMPKAVFCDFSIIAAAPARLSKSGLGDSLARSTAQADWLLSHLLLQTAYNDVPFCLLAPLEPHLFENARGVAKGDPASIELLMQVLLLSGLGMTMAQGSYPASQAEHMVAHAYGMLKNVPAHIPRFHGEEIGVTALAMAHRQERLLRTSPTLQALSFPDAAITELFGGHAASEAKKAYRIKQEAIEEARLNNAALAGQWETVADRIAPIMLSPQKIQAILKAAQAPDSVEALGWSLTPYNAVETHARFLRERFTCLDLQ